MLLFFSLFSNTNNASSHSFRSADTFVTIVKLIINNWPSLLKPYRNKYGYIIFIRFQIQPQPSTRYKISLIQHHQYYWFTWLLGRFVLNCRKWKFMRVFGDIFCTVCLIISNQSTEFYHVILFILINTTRLHDLYQFSCAWPRAIYMETTLLMK